MAQVPQDARRLPHTRLAEGEVTGHYHQAEGPEVALYEHGASVILEAPVGATVTHQEHGPVVLPPGVYDRTIVAEYDHFAEEERQVRD
jgi:hypothetical protein